MTDAASDPLAEFVPDVASLGRRLADNAYLADQGLSTALFCAARLPQPLLLEGEAGVGKTAAAQALAAALDTRLVRLQCYEGIDSTRGAVRVELRPSAARHPPRRSPW